MHLVHSLHQLVQQLFLPFESSAHMVAYDIGKRSLLDRSAYAGQMEKAFITGRMFGTLRDRQPRGELYRQQRCVQHLVLGISRMYVQPFENDFGSGSIEVLVFQLADLSAVDRIGPFATELFDIEVVGSGSDLFVGRKPYANLAVFDLRMILQVFHGGDDSSHSSLIIRP